MFLWENEKLRKNSAKSPLLRQDQKGKRTGVILAPKYWRENFGGKIWHQNLVPKFWRQNISTTFWFFGLMT